MIISASITSTSSSPIWRARWRSIAECSGFTKTKEAHLEGEWIEKIVGLPGLRAQRCSSFRPVVSRGSSCSITIRRKASRSRKTPAPTPVGLRHFALRVTDIAAVTAKLRAAGIEVRGGADGGAGRRGEVRHRRGRQDPRLLRRSRRGHRRVGRVSLRAAEILERSSALIRAHQRKPLGSESAKISADQRSKIGRLGAFAQSALART